MEQFFSKSRHHVFFVILFSCLLYTTDIFCQITISPTLIHEEWKDPSTGLIYYCSSTWDTDGKFMYASAWICGSENLKGSDIVIPSTVIFEKAGEQPITGIGIRRWPSLGDVPVFSGYDNLKSISIPNTVTYIGESCFRNCKNLKTVKLSNNIECISSYCFMGCSSLKTIDIPSAKRILNGAFANCTNLETVHLAEGLEKIESSCFANCASLKTINIPNGLKELGGSTFYGCSKLETINIPSSLKDLGDQVFWGCEQLKNIELPEGLEIFGASGTFYGCSNLKTIQFPKKVNIPGSGGWEGVLNTTFQGCSSLESIELPVGVKIIGEKTFDGCTTLKKNLKKLILPEGVETLNRCFMDFTGLEEVYFPNSLNTIYRAFTGCINLKTATIPNSVTTLSGAFVNCKNLVSIKLPNAITELSGFSGCCSLSEVEIPECVESIEAETFKDCTSLRYIKIPASVTSIGHGAFNGCSSLKTISLTKGLQTISAYAFYNCSSLESLSIPSSVISINCYSFENCFNLKDVYVYWNTPFTQFEKSESFSSEEQLFKVYDKDSNYDRDHVYYNAHLHVPDGTELDYKQVSPWSLFWTINKIEKGEKHFKLSAKNYTREYGDANPSFDFVESGGTISSGIPTLTCEATSTSPVGTYPIVISKGSVTNNDVELVNGTLTISKAPLTIKANDCSKKEREENPAFTFTYTGFKNSETEKVLSTLPTGSCSATKASEVGTYPIIASGAEATNYYFIYENGTLTIQENESDEFNNGDWFTSNSVEGIEITYEVINNVEKTCRVLGNENSNVAVAISTNSEGDLTIPATVKGYTVTEIGDKAFFGCNRLTKIVIPNFINTIGSSAFWGCKGLTSIEIPSSVTSIGGGAFDECSGLLSVTFPSGIKSLGNCIFRSCKGIQTVIIPKDIKSIGIATFVGCSSISNVYCMADKAPGGGDSFDNPGNMTLHVPLKSISQYQKTYGWKEFGNIDALKEGDPGYSEDLDDEDDNIPEPYAALSDDNKTLTFYYDGKKKSRNGMGIGPFTQTLNFEENDYSIDSQWYDQRWNISTVEFDDSFANYTDLTSTAYWFYDCSKLKTIKGLENLNTSNVTNMSYMFCNCNSLTALDLSSFNTANVRTMYWMFEGCSSLTSIDVSQFNTANVIYMGGMFEGCSSLTSLDVTNFNTAKVEAMGNMFWGCSSLKSLDVSNFNTTNVIGMTNMFRDCSSLKSLDVSNFNTTKTQMMDGMFLSCSALATIYCDNAWGCITSEGMFSGCTSLKGAISYDSNKTDVTYANPTTGYFTSKKTDPEIIKFADSKVKEICLKYWDFNEDGEFSMTEAAGVLWIGNAFVESEITSFNEFSYFTAVTDIDDAAFRKCKNLKEITLPNSATSIGKQTFAYCQNLTKVVMSTSMTSIGDYAFMSCNNLTNIEFSDNLTKIGDGAFENCSSLSTINIPASVFYIGGSPFDSCSGLMSINVNSGNMRYCSVDGVLFDKACTKLVQYPIGKKGSEYVIPSTVITIGEGAFISSTNLHTITIPESVTTIGLGAFMDCTSLGMITIPQSVTSLAKYSFYGCTGLKSVTSITANPFEIESNVFETSNNTFTTATLYVPIGSASKYQTVGGWKNFKKFMPIGDVNGDNAINDADTKEEVDYIMGNPSKTYVKAAGDMNGDGVINVVDIVLMRDMINSNK